MSRSGHELADGTESEAPKYAPFYHRYKRLSAAISHWKSWYFWATHCRLDPVVKVAKMLKSRETQVFNYFIHRITNALSEGINSKVEAIKNAARGFRNAERFKIMIWFRLGGLSLYPVTNGKP